MRTKGTKKMLKAAALAAVLTAVMLGSSGCITIDLGGVAAPIPINTQ
ncbi:MAG TPA: hypothetical protein VFW69_08545 [Mycobacterium sp.]|nr:hypothetical protein [Mycobacterium sp.]